MPCWETGKHSMFHVWIGYASHLLYNTWPMMTDTPVLYHIIHSVFIHSI